MGGGGDEGKSRFCSIHQLEIKMLRAGTEYILISISQNFFFQHIQHQFNFKIQARHRIQTFIKKEHNVNP